jgi:hypothetical protein
MSMKKGEESRLEITGDYAYGARGFPASVTEGVQVSACMTRANVLVCERAREVLRQCIYTHAMRRYRVWLTAGASDRTRRCSSTSRSYRWSKAYDRDHLRMSALRWEADPSVACAEVHRTTLSARSSVRHRTARRASILAEQHHAYTTHIQAHTHYSSTPRLTHSNQRLWKARTVCTRCSKCTTRHSVDAVRKISYECMRHLC